MNIVVKESFLFMFTRYLVYADGVYMGRATAMDGELSLPDVNEGELIEIKNIRNKEIVNFIVTDAEETVLILRKHYFYYCELAVFILFGLFSGFNISHASNMLYSLFLLVAAMMMLGHNIYTMMRPFGAITIKRLGKRY